VRSLNQAFARRLVTVRGLDSGIPAGMTGLRAKLRIADSQPNHTKQPLSLRLCAFAPLRETFFLPDAA